MKNDVPIIGSQKTIRTSVSKAHLQSSMHIESYNQTRGFRSDRMESFVTKEKAAAAAFFYLPL